MRDSYMAKKDTDGRAYSPASVIRELKNVKWPTFGELMKTSALVIVFTVLFGVYFFICELAASGLINAIVGAK
jgi:preprotein translocase subunit SecE